MVELRGVSKRYGDLIAVRDVSLAIRRGEFITLLGPSGCGKTTLLRMLAGFETPDAGRVLIDGKDVTDVPPNKRNVNQVFQSYALFPHLTVEGNIAFGLQMKRLRKSEIAATVRRAIELVALQGKETAKPATLSGGQRQRVALARAIVCEPKVLLLDEPLSALDAKLRGQMQIELKTLQRTLGITFVFVTHAQEEALTMSDRIAVLHRGAIVQLGTADEIYHRPKTRFVAEFIGQANIFTATVTGRADGDVITEEKHAVSDRAGARFTQGSRHAVRQRQPVLAGLCAARRRVRARNCVATVDADDGNAAGVHALHADLADVRALERPPRAAVVQQDGAAHAHRHLAGRGECKRCLALDGREIDAVRRGHLLPRRPRRPRRPRQEEEHARGCVCRRDGDGAAVDGRHGVRVYRPDKTTSRGGLVLESLTTRTRQSQPAAHEFGVSPRYQTPIW